MTIDIKKQRALAENTLAQTGPNVTGSASWFRARAAEHAQTIIAILADIENSVMHTLCVECGPNVRTDEDGCCSMCGGNAVGTWLDARQGLKTPAVDSTMDKLRGQLESACVAAKALVSSISELGGIVDDNDPAVMALAGPIGAAEADLLVALGIYEEGRAEIVKFGALGGPAASITLEQITALFAKHCECRPIDLNRKADDHAAIHDCDTDILALVQRALFGDGEDRRIARLYCADLIRGAK